MALRAALLKHMPAVTAGMNRLNKLQESGTMRFAAPCCIRCIIANNYIDNAGRDRASNRKAERERRRYLTYKNSYVR